MELRYLPVTHDELPVRKTFEIDGNVYDIEFHYNTKFDFYTMAIFDTEDNLLFTTKLCYLTDALHAVVEELSGEHGIVPLIETDASREFPQVERMGVDNFDAIKVCLV